jgi:hypothetical protein
MGRTRPIRMLMDSLMRLRSPISSLSSIFIKGVVPNDVMDSLIKTWISSLSFPLPLSLPLNENPRLVYESALVTDIPEDSIGDYQSVPACYFECRPATA